MIIVGWASFVILWASRPASGLPAASSSARSAQWADVQQDAPPLGMARPQNVRGAYRSMRRDVIAMRAGAAIAAAPARWIAGRVRPGNSVVYTALSVCTQRDGTQVA